MLYAFLKSNKYTSFWPNYGNVNLNLARVSQLKKNYFIVLVPFTILQQVLKERNHITTDDLDQLRTDDLAQNMFLIFVMDLNYES